MFSIIIPLYNKEKYIAKAINSVISQSIMDFELIIVNDGSTDNSLEVARSVKDKRIVIISQKNYGVSTARNNGVKQSKNNFIAFLDADDWWEPTYLGEMKKLIEEFPEAGIYGCGYYIVKNGQKRIAPIGVKTNFKRGIINYCQVYSNTLCMPLWTGSTIIKKTIFDSENGFKQNLKLGEDFDLWIRVAMKYSVALLNKPLANYNQDVELIGRAVGVQLYEPEQHMLFTDYGDLQELPDFRYLYERLAVSGLLPYYLVQKNINQVNTILSSIKWKEHAFKYKLYYQILPRALVKLIFRFFEKGSIVKNKLKQYINKI